MKKQIYVILIISLLLSGCASSGPKVSPSWYAIAGIDNITGPKTQEGRRVKLYTTYYAWYHPKDNIVLIQVGYYKDPVYYSSGQGMQTYKLVKRSLFVLDPQTKLGAVVSTNHPDELITWDNVVRSGAYVIPEDEKIDFFRDKREETAELKKLSEEERRTFRRLLGEDKNLATETPDSVKLKALEPTIIFFNFGKPLSREKQNYFDKLELNKFNTAINSLINDLKAEIKKNPNWKETEVRNPTSRQMKYRENAREIMVNFKGYCPEPGTTGWLPYCNDAGRLDFKVMEKLLGKKTKTCGTRFCIDGDLLFEQKCKSAFEHKEWNMCTDQYNYFTVSEKLPELADDARAVLRGKNKLDDLIQYLISLRPGRGK